MDKAEIIIYKQDDDSDFQIEVRVDEETVWLTQAQMVNLFSATKQNIILHISNIFKEGELQRDSVVKEYLTTASDRTRFSGITGFSLSVAVYHESRSITYNLSRFIY